MKKNRTISSNIPKLSLSLLTNPNLFLQEYSIPSIQATGLFFNSIFFQFKIHIFVSCSLYYWIPQIFNFFWKNIFESIFVCMCMVTSTNSEEFVLLSRVWMGHKCEFAFAVKVQSEICGSLGRTLATLRYRESEGEKKTLRHTGDSYGRPLPSSFEFFGFVFLSLCVFVVLIRFWNFPVISG